jgi:RNA polymerase sigma-70 factor (ECF subfamily)
LEGQSQISAVEQEIVRLLASNNKRAVELIYNNYSPALLGIILRIVNDQQLAEDVLQESLVKIWRNASSYNPGISRLFTWMVNICRNTAIDQVRSKGYRKASKIRGDETSVIGKTNSDESIQPELIGVKDLVGKLKIEQRSLIELAYFKGYTHQELAEELNLPLGTVKTRIRKALMDLRQFVNERVT